MEILEALVIAIIILVVVFATGFAIRFYYKIFRGQDPFDFMNK